MGIQDPVDAVRVVRDSASQLGKGFGFVQFSDQAAARAALGCDGQLLRKRPIRVTKAVKVPAHLKDMGKAKPGKKLIGKDASERVSAAGRFGHIPCRACLTMLLCTQLYKIPYGLQSVFGDQTMQILGSNGHCSLYCTVSSEYKCCAGFKQGRPSNKAVAALQRKAEPAESWQGFKTKGSKKTVAAAITKSTGTGQRVVESKRKTSEKRPAVVMRKQRSLAK